MENIIIYVPPEQMEHIKEARGFIEVWQYSRFEPPHTQEFGRFESHTAYIRFFRKKK